MVDEIRPYHKLASPVRLTNWGFERNGDPPRIVGEYSAYTNQAIDQGYRAVQELLIRADAEDLSGLPVGTKDCGNSVLDFAFGTVPTNSNWVCGVPQPSAFQKLRN
jgi:hypothetical protein